MRHESGLSTKPQTGPHETLEERVVRAHPAKISVQPLSVDRKITAQRPQ
jgi:hypothetical protein